MNNSFNNYNNNNNNNYASMTYTDGFFPKNKRKMLKNSSVLKPKRESSNDNFNTISFTKFNRTSNNFYKK